MALLVGPNAPLEVSPVKQNYFRHAFDFYKPDLTSEYPIVDGALSIKQYYEALDRCYQGWRSKAKNVHDSTRPHQVRCSKNEFHVRVICSAISYAKLNKCLYFHRDQRFLLLHAQFRCLRGSTTYASTRPSANWCKSHLAG